VKIICLVKQVPRADSIEFDPETKSLRREGVPLLLNPFDAAAVAHAAELKRKHGDGEVIAMTMGPPQAAEALKECLALGADRCIHLSDRAFAVADTLGTSRTRSPRRATSISSSAAGSPPTPRRGRCRRRPPRFSAGRT
jgi:electron transfer flavoprotein beta subunit